MLITERVKELPHSKNMITAFKKVKDFEKCTKRTTAKPQTKQTITSYYIDLHDSCIRSFEQVSQFGSHLELRHGGEFVAAQGASMALVTTLCLSLQPCYCVLVSILLRGPTTCSCLTCTQHKLSIFRTQTRTITFRWHIHEPNQQKKNIVLFSLNTNQRHTHTICRNFVMLLTHRWPWNKVKVTMKWSQGQRSWYEVLSQRTS